MSTISGVSGSSNAWAALNTQRSQHQAKMFAKVDADSSGGVDQAELGTMLSAISEKTGTSLGDSKELFTQMDSDSDGSLSADELGAGMKSLMPPPPSTMEFAQSRGMGGGGGGPDELFAKLDSDGDGTLSQTEFEAGRPQPPEGAQRSQRSDGPKGPPPAGGPGGSQSASKSDTTYDALDTNQDGTVSELERLIGELQNTSSNVGSDDGATNNAASFDIATLAKQIYAQVAKGLSANDSGLLNASA